MVAERRGRPLAATSAVAGQTVAGAPGDAAASAEKEQPGGYGVALSAVSSVLGSPGSAGPPGSAMRCRCFVSSVV